MRRAAPAPARRLSRRSFLAASAGGLAALGRRPSAAHAADPDLVWMTLAEASAALRAGRVSSLDLTRACLERIDRLQPAVNAFISITRDEALADARERDAERAAGRWRGPLHGIPIALKDNIDTAGVRTSAASAVFSDRIPAEDAEVVQRLKAGGAVLLGKLNMDEFAVGGTSTSTYFGPVRNPWALDRSAGGSSGGSAAAVAAGLCFGALGTDTTGSLRIPAAFCGVVGLKPTYGRVSVRGVVPFSWTLDHVGPLARTVEDAALVLQVIAGPDPREPSSVNAPTEDYFGALRGVNVAALRIGLPRAAFYDRLDPEVEAAIAAALGVLRGLAPGMRDVRLPSVMTTPLVTDEELYAYHSDWFARVPELYQPGTRRVLEGAAKLIARDYIQARREIEDLRQRIRAVFDGVDALVMPTTKILPRTIEECLKRAESDRPLGPELSNTSAFNILGLPALSVPCGFGASGLPIGLQIVGPPLGEARVLAVARAYEQATTWRARHPR